MSDLPWTLTLQWRHHEQVGVSNHQPQDCLLNCLFRHRSKKIPKLRVTDFCAGNSPVTGELPAQRAINAENISIWRRHHEQGVSLLIFNSVCLDQWLIDEIVIFKIYQTLQHKHNAILIHIFPKPHHIGNVCDLQTITLEDRLLPRVRGFWSCFGGVCSLTYCNGNFRGTMVSEPFNVIL